MSTPAANTRSTRSSTAKAQQLDGNATTTTEQPPQNGGAEQQEPEQEQSTTEPEPEGGYPPQRHAGAVGYGPEYGAMHRATLGDKIIGLKDEVAGKITRNPDKVQHGKEQKSGELKRKQLEERDKEGPFGHADDEKPAEEDKEEDQNEEQGGERKRAKTDGEDAASETKDEDRMQEDTEPNAGSSDVPGSGNTAPSSVTGERGRGAHPTEKGALEQAATTAPAGTEEAEQQRRGENAYAVKDIDEAEAAA